MKRSWLDFFANLLLAIAVTVFFAEALSRLIPNVWVHWSIPVLLAVGGLVHLERLSREGAHEQGVVIDAQDPKAARQWFQTEADEFLKQRFVKRWSLLVAGASIFSSFSLFALGFHWFGAQGEIEAAQKRLDGMDEQVKAGPAKAEEKSAAGHPVIEHAVIEHSATEHSVAEPVMVTESACNHGRRRNRSTG